MRNPYRDEFVNSDFNFQTVDFDVSSVMTEARRDLCRKYAWAIPDQCFARQLQRFIAPKLLLEVGAGSGYWAYYLRQYGVPMVATDPFPFRSKWTEGKFSAVKRLTALESIHRFPQHVLMMVWPEGYNTMAVDALRAYRGSHFVFVGEPAKVFYQGAMRRGITADPGFYHVLFNEWELITRTEPLYNYKGIHTEHHFYVRQGTLTETESDTLREDMAAIN